MRKWAAKLRRKFGKKLDPNQVTLKEALGWFEERRPGYEELASHLAPYLPPDGVLLDIGSNIGFFTKVLAEKTGFRGKALLFEAVPHLAALSRETLSQAAFRFEVFPYGLGDKNESLSMHTSKDGNIGWNTFISEKAQPGMARTSVEVRIFDELGVGDTPSVVKIDVEGSEYRVLRGMTRSLASWNPKPVILCELSWGKMHPHWREQSEVLRDLLTLGFDLCRLDGSRILPDQVHEEQVTTDYLFLPRGRAFLAPAPSTNTQHQGVSREN